MVFHHRTQGPQFHEVKGLCTQYLRHAQKGRNRWFQQRPRITDQGRHTQEGRNKWFQQRPRNEDQGVGGRCENCAKASGTGKIERGPQPQKCDKGIGARNRSGTGSGRYGCGHSVAR